MTDGYQTDLDLAERLSTLKQRFRPSAPVNRQDLFKGRVEQLSAVFDVVSELGQHGILYGERGVGKTSLSEVTRAIFVRRLGGMQSVRVQCSADDNFASIWQKFIDAMTAEIDVAPPDEARAMGEAVAKAAEIINYDEVSPDRAYRALRVIAKDTPLLLVVDEFDRVPEQAARELFSDLVKALSDGLVECTILIVGVADDVTELIAGHRSVERALVQIPMPRMTPDELRTIVTEGLAAANITVQDSVVDRIVQLSQGLPHYTHLLGGLAGEIALLAGQNSVDHVILEQAVRRALSKAQQSVISAYTAATSSAREDTLHRQVLLACALTGCDELGFFAPADVRRPFSRIMGQPKQMAAYSRHLPALCGEGRGEVLEAKGPDRKRRYRFTNPLLQPYVIMRGLAEELITTADLPPSEPLGTRLFES